MLEDHDLFQGNLTCLREYRARIDARRLKPKVRGKWDWELYAFLQYLTIESRITVDHASPEQVRAWLEPALGFSDHDLRLDLLNFLASWISNPALNQPRQRGSRFVRRCQELVFWRSYWKRLNERTRLYFESIRQEDILEAEIRCEPFYRAYHESNPAWDGGGVFEDSDSEVIERLKSFGPMSDVKSILDIGCGGGRLLKKLGQLFPGAKLLGTSIFKFTEAEASALGAAGITPVYASAGWTGLPDASQDVVVSTEVIEHLRHPEEMLKEVARILRPGGVFCITAPNRNASYFCANPFSYLGVALGTVWPSALPPFHDLYSPLTRIPLVHYGFELQEFKKMFDSSFSEVRAETTRFVALKKFRLDRVAPRLPVLKKMGGLCIVVGRHLVR